MSSWFHRIMYYGTYVALISLLLLGGCNNLISDNPITTAHKMYVYSNSGNIFYLVDYETFEVVREIQLNVPDTVICYGVTISTNRNNLFFRAIVLNPRSRYGFMTYDITQENSKDLFFTDLIVGEPADFISAQNTSAPGLVYIHFRDVGTYLIDLFTQKVQEFISNEHNFSLNKRIYHSADEKCDIVFKEWNIKHGFTELEFYAAGSNLHDIQFVLNQANKDSIYIYDFVITKNHKLHASYLLSGGRSRGIESYLGSYDLQTKQFSRSMLSFPWSLSPYYMAYSSPRNEIYMIGGYDKFYVIDAESYSVKSIITLPGKIPGPSRILIRPDDSVAFVSCSNSNMIFVLDLNSRSIIKTINVKTPYKMIVP